MMKSVNSPRFSCVLLILWYFYCGGPSLLCLHYDNDSPTLLHGVVQAQGVSAPPSGDWWMQAVQLDREIVYGTSASPAWNFTSPANTWEKHYPDCAGFLQSPIAVDMSSVQSALDGFLQLLFPNTLLASNSEPTTARKVTYNLIHAANEEKLYMLNVTSLDITLFSSSLPHYYRLSYVRVYGSMHRFNQAFQKTDGGTTAAPSSAGANTASAPTSPATSTVQDIEIVYEFIPISPIERFMSTPGRPGNSTRVPNKWAVLPRVMVSFLIKDAAIATKATTGASTITMDPDLELFISGVDDVPFVYRPTMDRLMGGGDTFLMYPGSIPNPPCTESVVWMVSPNPILASKKQMALLLASVKEGKPPTETSVAKQLKNAPSDAEALAQLNPFRRPLFGANGRSIVSKNFKSS